MRSLCLYRHILVTLLAAACLVSAGPGLRAQDSVIITEFMANNGGGLLDEDLSSSDWVELFNAGTNVVNLSGWGLSDNPLNPKKWLFPSTNIPPNQYLVLFCSSKDRRVPGAPLHTSFGLSAAGEYIGLCKPSGQVVSEFTFGKQEANVSYGLASEYVSTNLLLTAGSVARAYVPTNDIGSNWIRQAFDDSAWLSGISGVGFDVSTNAVQFDSLIGLNVETLMVNAPVKRGSVYVRIPVNVTDPAGLGEIQLSMRYDDGFVAYLNGVEVARKNVSALQRWNSSASVSRTNSDAIKPELFSKPGMGALLQPGQNVLAIHGLNRLSTDPDLLVLPELLNVKVVFQTNTARFFATATPGGANSAGVADVALSPVFSVPGGIYTNSQSVMLTTTEPGAVIRYTLDRKDPSETSPIYSNAIPVSGSTVIRARVFRAGFLPSRVVAEHYSIVDSQVRDFTSNLPIIVISTHAQPIVDAIEIQSGCRVFPTVRGRSSIRAVPEFNGWCGVAQRGSSSTGFPKPSLSFKTRDEFGDDFKIPLLGMPSDADWILYAPYTDKTFMRDALAYELASQMGWWSSRHQFVEVFVDSGGTLGMGDYYGIYVLLEKIKISPDRVDIPGLGPQDNAEPDITGGYIFKKDRLDPGDNGFATTRYGSFAFVDPKEQFISTAQKNYLVGYLNSFERSLYGADFNKVGNTNHYENFIDVDSFIDQMWMVESSKQIDGYRLSNFMHKQRNGKLFMMPIWDYNLSYGNANYLEGDKFAGWYYTLGDIWNTDALPWFGRLLEDRNYTQRFIDRWYLLRKGVYETGHVLAIVDEWARLLDEAQERDFKAWPRLGTYIWPNADADWPNTTLAGHVSYMTNFIRDRFAWIDSQWVAAPRLGLPEGKVSPGDLLEMSATLGTNVTVYYTVDGSDPRASGGLPAPAARIYSAPLVLTSNLRVMARAYHRTNSWSAPVESTYYTQLPSLLLTELMYHPAGASAAEKAVLTNSLPAGSVNADLFEYMEILNTGTSAVDLTGVHFTRGVTFDFTGSSVTSLAPGARVLVVKNLAAFRLRYGSLPSVAGEYAGALSDSGERVTLVGRYLEPLADIDYKDGWKAMADGFGFSLNLVAEGAAPLDWSDKAAWTQSAVIGGTPGLPAGVSPVIPEVVINEVRTGDVVHRDAVEFRNLSTVPADISGWFLTDDRNRPRKYVFPAGSVIAPGGYASVSSSEFGADPANGFGLSALGEEIFLYSANGTSLTGYRDGFQFRGAETGVTYGRHVVTGRSGADYPVQIQPSIGAVNSGPRVGPVILTEVQFHPADVFLNGAYWDNTEHEFLELKNISPAAVPLFDPLNPVATWHLRGAVGFEFPTNITVPAGGYVLVVGFDPVAAPDLLAGFKARYSLGAGAVILGPWSGKLDNSADEIRLLRPGAPLPPESPDAGEVPYILADLFAYSGDVPSFAVADGAGASLQRRVESGYGNDPANWTVAAPSPAASSSAGIAPSITAPPVAVSVVGGQSAQFTVAAQGSATLLYQWLFNGVALSGASEPTLTLNGVTKLQQGGYRVAIYNGTGSVISEEVFLQVNLPPAVTAQPALVMVRPGDTAELNVGASGDGILGYQWFRNGVPVPGANTPRLQISNAQPLPDGNATNGSYHVVVSSVFGSAASQPAQVLVFVRPTIVGQPQPLTVLAGEPVNFYVRTTGTWPNNYRWRRNLATVTNYYLNSADSSHGIAKVLTTQAGTYSLLITNLMKDSVTSSNFTLVVLADADADGMADVWETAQGLNPASAADADLDSDGDGVSNRAEYVAGTNPKDPASRLKLNLSLVNDQVTLSFDAARDRTFSLQFLDNVTSGAWQTLASYPTSAVARVVTLVDVLPRGAGRMYRVVAPQSIPGRVWGPLILTSPQPVTVATGGHFGLSVVASGSGAVQVQWNKDGVPIPGATAPIYAVDAARSSDAGQYTATLKDADGTTTTVPVAVTVTP